MAAKRWFVVHLILSFGILIFLKDNLFGTTLAQYPTITPPGSGSPTATIQPPVNEGGATCKGLNVSQVICPLTGGSNKLYVVAVSNRNNIGVNNVSGVGLTWDKRKVQCNTFNTYGLEIWTAFGSPPDGNVTINLNSSSPSVIASIERYANADPSNPVENWVGSNTNGQESTNCSSGSWSTNTSLDMTSTLDSSVLYAASEAVRRTITVPDPGYSEIAADLNGSNQHLYVHQRVLNSAGTDNISHTLSSAEFWLMAGIVIRPVPPPSEIPSPTPFSIYGWVYNEINNNINRATAESEGLISGLTLNLYGDAFNSTISQPSPVSGYLGNYRFSELGNGVYFVDLMDTPANSVLYNPAGYTNPQVAIVAGGSVIVDFPFVTVTPTFAPGVPTNTPPGGGLPTNSPTPTNANITPTGVITPTSIISPPEVCQTLPTPDLLGPDHDICTNVKPTFAAYVADPNGDNVWARYQAGGVFDARGNIAPSTGGESNFIPADYELNQSTAFWWTAFTQSSSCPESSEAPSRLITLDYTPPSQPAPPICSLVSQDYVTGETTFYCTWEDPGNTFGCGQTVDYHPYFWSEPGSSSWDPGWVGDSGGITVVVEDGHELFGQLIVKDNLGNISEISIIGGPFTAPKINYSATVTPGGPTLTPSLSPTPSLTLTPTPGAWLQVRGGDVFQPVINQPVPPGQYFLDLLPTPAENPNSAGLIWTNTGSGNFGFGSSSPINWEVSGQLTNAYSFPYYWETLRNRAKEVNSSTVGIIDSSPESTPAPSPEITNLLVNDSVNAADWHIKSDLQIGNTQYGDRAYTFSNIPAQFLGAAWIQTANDSRAYTSEPLATFDVNIDSTVYLAHEDTITPKPAWMTTWTDSGLDVTNDEATPKVFSLYTKEFTAGTVTVGSNGTLGKPMYSIFVLSNVTAPTPTGEPSGNLDSINNIYSYQSAGYYALDPNFDGNRTAGPDVTVILVSGTLEISQNFSLTDSEDIVVFIVNGNIHLDGNVNYLPGIYISSQTFNIAASNEPLTIEGMIYAKRFNFLRTYINPNIPTYQIIYQPDYLIKLLPYLGRSQINWQDLSP